MAKRTKKAQVKKTEEPQKVVKQDVLSATGEQQVNRNKDGTFKKGIKPKVGFQVSPENIDRTGASQRATYNKNLLQEMLLLPLDDRAQEQFIKLKALFPNHFKGTDEKNWQFFMELQQLNLVFHKNPNVAQKAMQEIRDRIDGKAIQRVENKISTQKSVDSFLSQFENEE